MAVTGALKGEPAEITRTGGRDVAPLGSARREDWEGRDEAFRAGA